MPEEETKPAIETPATPQTPKPDGAKGGDTISALLGAAKLDWIRPLIYKIGGRKMLAGGGGLAVINEIAKSEMGETVKIIACICAAVVAIGTSISIAIEDRSKK